MWPLIISQLIVHTFTMWFANVGYPLLITLYLHMYLAIFSYTIDPETELLLSPRLIGFYSRSGYLYEI